MNFKDYLDEVIMRQLNESGGKTKTIVTYKVKAKTKDIHGAETGWSDPLQVTILEKNKAPYTPKNPTPSHQSESIPILTTLSWTGGDPNDGDEVTYDLYISNCPEPDYYPAYAEDLTESEYKDIYLVPDQHYYWRINATDEHGLYNLGPIWNFSTKTLDQVDPTDNNKPGKPEKPLLTPLMPPYLHVGEYCSLTTKVIDPDGDNVNVFYDMDEDGCVDAELLNVSSGEGCTIVYKWDKTPGWHNIRVIATDVFSAISDWSYSLAVNVYPAAENNPPNNASIPGGDNLGYGCEEYTYTTFSVDPDGDDVYYKFDWGDGSYSNWIGPYDSGTAGSCSHYWASTGYYDIRAKVKDYKGKERPWSEAKTVSIVQPGTATIFKHGNFTGATDGDIFDNFPGQGRLRYANGTAGTFVTGAYGGFPYGNAWSMGCQGVEFYVGRTKELTIDAEICFMGGTESALFAPVSIQKVIRVDNFFKPDKEYQKDMENTIGALENLEDLCAATISLLASISPAVWEEGYIYELTKTSFWTEEYLELYNYDVEQAEQLIAKYTGESKMGSKAIENYIKSWRDIRLDGGVKIDPGASSSGASGSATPRIEIAGQPVTTIGGLLLIITIAHQLWTLYQMMTHWQVDTLLEKFENIGQAYTEHAKKTFTFEEGTHDVWAGMRTEATGWLLFFGFAYAVGMVKSITIDGIAPPETPTLTPPQVLRANQVCKFTGFCMDQNDDPVRYIIDWGDGSDTTTELFPSGEDATIEHAYSDVGTYTITVKSEDCDKLQSAGSYTLDVNVLKGKNDAYVNSNPTSTQQQTVPSSQQQTVPSELPGQSTQPDSQSL